MIEYLDLISTNELAGNEGIERAFTARGNRLAVTGEIGAIWNTEDLAGGPITFLEANGAAGLIYPQDMVIEIC